MKILFLEIDTDCEWAVASVGPAFLAAVLRDRGHEVAFRRVGIGEALAEVRATVQEIAPDLLALSLTSRQWLRARSLIRDLRSELDVPVVAGGLHPTFSPEAVLDSPGFDYVCLGEGEGALSDLVEALAAGQIGDSIEIDNIWRRGGQRPPLRPPITPLDDVPFMARDLLDEPSGIVHMATQRGCPYPCTYCAARNFDELYGQTAEYGRRRSEENVLAELETLHTEGSVHYVIFLDDTFTIRRRWVERFCRSYGERFGTHFALHARIETIDERLLECLASAGCRHITYGVESGSPRIRRDVMRRPMSDERIKRVFRWTEEAGIMVTANYMLGLPGETRGDLERTLGLAEELETLDFGYFVFYPYPGTHLFELCRQRGYLPDDYLDRPVSHNRSILRLPDLSGEEIAEVCDRFTALRERLYLDRFQGPPDLEAQMLKELRRSANRA